MRIKIYKKKSSKNSIGLSTFALYDITKNIVGDTQDLFMIVPFGADVHSFEPNPKLIAKMKESPLIIYSGANLQPWIDRFKFEHQAIDMSKFVELKKAHHKHHEEAHDDEHEHHHGAIDPHYWLDISNMQKMADIITKELIKISPKYKKLYERNRDLYVKKLQKLDADYKKSLSECKKDTIVVNHNAFSYLSSRYGFKTEALSGLSPDAQSDAKTMIKLIEDIKKYNLSTIFFETFASDKAIKGIANETKVKVDILKALANITADDANNNLSYDFMMRENLKKISDALECSR